MSPPEGQKATGPRRLEPRLSARGHLQLHEPEDGAPIEALLAERFATAFAAGEGQLLLELAARHAGYALPPTWVWFRDLAAAYLERVRVVPEGGAVPVFALSDSESEAMLAARPAIVGADHLDEVVLFHLWSALDEAFRAGLATHGGSVQALLGAYDPGWHGVGRVVFNLAENKREPEYPFAFMATYTTRLAAGGKPQHQPLGQALSEYAGKGQKLQLTALLVPVQRAAEQCEWLAEMVRAQEIFEPLKLTVDEAAQVLLDVPRLEQAGVVVRMPQQWGGMRPPRPRVRATVGANAAAGIGRDALLDFQVEVTLDGEPLTEEEIAQLLAQASGLALLRGRWVELDARQLAKARERFEKLAREASEGLSFNSAMQLLAGAELHGMDVPDPQWSEVHGGEWLEAQLTTLRAVDHAVDHAVEAGRVDGLAGTLRPYQAVGVRWLDGLTQLGLGALLADDMGLGKTIQVIALMLIAKARGGRSGPSLLVVPASLIGNWSQELARFAPSLRVLVVHTSALSPGDIAALDKTALRAYDVVITTYGMASREASANWRDAVRWQHLIADEAQALKNAETRAARALKAISAKTRIAMTGTPIENRLGDLWSLFDFLNPGLLGTTSAFNSWMKGARAKVSLAPDATRITASPWGPLRELVKPYILRRKKTDKSIISDLPDKTEIDTFCSLSRRQAALYQEAVDDLAKKLAQSSGIQRRGLVLAALMRLKQICNHPSQWLGDGDWRIGDSGKLLRLKEIAETILATQEKVLVFTQFREISDVLARALTAIFGAPGLVLTGQTKVADRKELVRRFQEDESIPFFVLSLKAGGTGLNLTAASHVVHFDRWWNPAVEDQATDRAFRLGQTKNVLVHKLVCRGTVEERIADMIRSKRALAGEIIEGGGEVHLTELSDEALLQMVRLDIHAATSEA